MKKYVLLILACAMIGCEKNMSESSALNLDEVRNSEKGAAKADVSKLDTIENDGLVVRFSQGYSREAATQMARLVSMRNFYNNKLGLDIKTAINILDREDLESIVGKDIPYGMPFVVDATNEIFLPATEEGVIIDATLKYKNAIPKEAIVLFEEAGFTPEEAIKKYPSLIGLHEVGHTVVFEVFHDRTGKYPVWFHELMATYASYSFMLEEYPELANVWIGNAYIRYLDGSKPEYTTFEEFALYAPENMSSANYDWYQKQINFIARDLHKEMGLDFFKVAKENLTKDKYTSEEMIEEFKKLSPIFVKWVETLDDKTQSYNSI